MVDCLRREAVPAFQLVHAVRRISVACSVCAQATRVVYDVWESRFPEDVVVLEVEVAHGNRRGLGDVTACRDGVWVPVARVVPGNRREIAVCRAPQELCRAVGRRRAGPRQDERLSPCGHKAKRLVVPERRGIQPRSFRRARVSNVNDGFRGCWRPGLGVKRNLPAGDAPEHIGDVARARKAPLLNRVGFVCVFVDDYCVRESVCGGRRLGGCPRRSCHCQETG